MSSRAYLLVLFVATTSIIVGEINYFPVPIFWPSTLAVSFIPLAIHLPFVQKRYSKEFQFFKILHGPLSFIFVTLLVIVSLRFTLYLSYGVQIFARPLQDDALSAFDRFFGFEYSNIMRWVRTHPIKVRYLGRIYFLFPYFIVVMVWVGMFVHREDRIAERFFTSALIAFLLAFVICALFPAAGAVILLDPQTAALATGATPLPQFYALRAGTLHEIGLGAAGGLVSFPSMHVAMAMLAAYAVRRVLWLLALVLPFSAGFCVTAMTHGGHYLADCFGGVGVAILAIVLGGWLHGARLPQRPLLRQPRMALPSSESGHA